MIVVDSPVFVDSLFEGNEDGNRKATEFLNSIDNLIVYIPKIFLIELISAIKRLRISMSRKDIERLVAYFEILNEDFVFEEAIKVAEEVHPRAIDSYFIAAAKLTNSVLISCDRRMVENGRKYGVRACYLLQEFDDATKAVRKLKRGEQ
jgi:predicted nucleic acid-binding protein